MDWLLDELVDVMRWLVDGLEDLADVVYDLTGFDLPLPLLFLLLLCVFVLVARSLVRPR